MRRYAALALVAAILATALLLRLSQPMGADVSWLLTMGEKVLGGARAYVDIVETNPPAAFLIYLPAILLARLLHTAPETMVTLLVFAGACTSLGLCRAMLPRSAKADTAFCFALALLLILPADAFAERDHIALIAMLPLLTLWAARAEARPIPLPSALLAGLGGGIALCIKPHDLLALAPAFAFALWRNRRPRIFLPELLAAGSVCLVYGALILTVFPVYLHLTLPLVLAVYRPVAKAGWSWSNPSLLISAALLAATAVTRPRAVGALILALAGVGAALAIIVQSKGWPYHGYPAIMLLSLALGLSLDTARGARLAIAATILALCLGTAFLWLSTRRDTTRLTQAVAALAPPHPGIIAISPDIALGQPLTRRLGGDWRGTSFGLWVSQDSAILLKRGGLSPEQHDRLTAYAAAERRALARDIAQKRPDVVLIEAGWRTFAFSQPDIAAALKPYRLRATVDGVGIWLR